MYNTHATPRSTVTHLESKDTTWKTLTHSIISVLGDKLWATVFSQEALAKKCACARHVETVTQRPTLWASLTADDGVLQFARSDWSDMLRQENHPLQQVLKLTPTSNPESRMRQVRASIIRGLGCVRAPRVACERRPMATFAKSIHGGAGANGVLRRLFETVPRVHGPGGHRIGGVRSDAGRPQQRRVSAGPCRWKRGSTAGMRWLV